MQLTGPEVQVLVHVLLNKESSDLTKGRWEEYVEKDKIKQAQLYAILSALASSRVQTQFTGEDGKEYVRTEYKELDADMTADQKSFCLERLECGWNGNELMLVQPLREKLA